VRPMSKDLSNVRPQLYIKHKLEIRTENRGETRLYSKLQKSCMPRARERV